MSQNHRLQPEALMRQLLAAGVSGNLGFEYPCLEGLDCGRYLFSWGQIRELKIPFGDDYIYEMGITFSLGEGAIHDQERNFLIRTFAMQHLMSSAKDRGCHPRTYTGKAFPDSG